MTALEQQLILALANAADTADAVAPYARVVTAVGELELGNVPVSLGDYIRSLAPQGTMFDWAVRLRSKQ